MPDRAVVDDAYWTDPLPTPGLPRCPLCDAEMMPNIGGTWTCHKDHTPQPRALVALSEDRQAIVFLTRSNWWAGHYLNGYGDVGERAFIAEDTGQDAHEVLNAFLRERTP